MFIRHLNLAHLTAALFCVVATLAVAQDPGDVNADGRISQTDVHLTVQHLLGSDELTAGESVRADVNTAAGVDVGDVVSITNLFPDLDETWFELDGSASPRRMGEGVTECYNIGLALAPDGTPFTLIHDWDAVEIWQWDGSDWQPVPGGRFGTGGVGSTRFSQSPIGINDLGHIYAAWIEEVNNFRKVRVRWWNGDAWVEIDDEFTDEGLYGAFGSASAMAIDPNTGYPVLFHLGSLYEWEGGEVVLKATGFVRRWTGSHWEFLGDIAFVRSPRDDELPLIAIDSQGRPVIAWIDSSRNWGEQLFLCRWSGTDWEQLGANSASGEGLSQAVGLPINPAIAIDDNDCPTVAWIEYNKEKTLHVRRWTGSDWEALSGLGASGEATPFSGMSGISLAIDDVGTPTVVFRDGVSIRVAEWNDSKWSDLPTPRGFQGSSGALSSAFDSLGNLVISHRQVTNTFDYIGAWVRRLEGDEWQELGDGCQITGGVSRSYPDRYSRDTLLALDADGDPLIGFFEIHGRDRVFRLVEWTGSQWSEIDSSPLPYNYLPHDTQVLVTDSSGSPIVVRSYKVSRGVIIASQWIDDQWIEIGAGSASGEGIDRTSTDSDYPTIAIDSSDNPVVAWLEYLGDTELYIYIRRLVKDEWEEVSPGSASGSGIMPVSMALYPQIAIDENDNITVASCGRKSVYVTRWNGAEWEDVGAGSSSGEGIWTVPWALTVEISLHSIALDSHGFPVIAGRDFKFAPGRNHTLFCLRWDGAQWNQIMIPSVTDPALDEVGFSPIVRVDADDNIVLAYLSEDRHVMVRRWTGEVWEEVGQGSASGRGASETRHACESLAMVLDSEGNPAVAWSQHGWEIFFLTTGPGL